MDRIKHGRLIVVKDNLKLMDLLQVFEAGSQFAFRSVQRSPLIPVHAGRPIKDVHKLAANPLGSEDTGSSLITCDTTPRRKPGSVGKFIG